MALLSSRPLSMSLVVAGWTGRDGAAMEAHIAELEKLGVPRPKSTPIFYRTAASLLTQKPVIEVVGGHSSGEVEPVLFNLPSGLWVGVVPITPTEGSRRWVSPFRSSSARSQSVLNFGAGGYRWALGRNNHSLFCVAAWNQAALSGGRAQINAASSRPLGSVLRTWQRPASGDSHVLRHDCRSWRNRASGEV